MHLEGQSAIVTGGASGLGEATARALTDAGARVVIADFNAERGQQVADKTGARFVLADVCDTGQGRATVAAARELGVLRGLVNCAGVGHMQRVLDDDARAISLEDFDRIVRVNLVGSFNFLRLAAEAMSTNEPDAGGQRGAIVNTASVSAFEGMIGQVAYAASKAGVVGMTLPAARELARSGIRVNAIAPGPFETPILGEGPPTDRLRRRFERAHVFPARLGRSAEFASLAVQLLSNDFMNGAVVRIDGGMRL
ncbi:MAG: SDR family oxidoreductase [Streptomycetaceae bacterium]|nr:SDR family oxidoreductase [Streptomycetaceae bacterium]